MLIASALLTPLLIVLGALIGVGVGALYLFIAREPSPQQQRAREQAIAQDTARRTFDETIIRLFGEPPE